MVRQFAIPVLMMWATVAPAADQGPEGGKTFCQRLGVPLKMQSSTDPSDGALPGHPVYWMSQVTFGMVLVGGSRATRLGVEPVGEPSIAEYKEAAKKCEGTKKGAACHIDGGLRFHIETRKVKAEVESLPDEKAEVWTDGMTIYCRDA